MRIGSIGLAALVIGSVIAMDPGGWSPFGPAKWMVISTIGLAGGGWIIRQRTTAIDRRTMWVWVALLGFVTLGALTNGDAWTALLGHSDRHLGVLTWFLFWLLFSAGQLLDTGGQRVVLTAAAVAAGLMGLYASIELAGWQPIELATTSQRLTGTFGSASFLGAAACVLLPIAAALAVDPRRSTRLRVVFAAASALAVVALVGSGARAAWVGLGLAACAAVVAGGAAGHHDVHLVRRIRRVRPGLLAVCGAVCVVLVAVLMPRIGDVLERDHGAASRLDEWNVALRVIGDNPVLGVGPDGYRIAVAEGIDSHYERTYGRDHTLPDRAHSAPLDVALAGGIAAAIAYMMLIAFIVWRAVRLMRRDDAIGRGLAIGVTAYAIQQMFLFPLAELDPIWWLFAGIVVTSTAPAPVPAAAEACAANGISTVRPRILRAAAGTVAVCLAAPALVAGVLNLAADRLAKTSLEASSAGNRAAAANDADRATDLRPDIVAYHLIAADAHLRLGTLADIDTAIAEARSALRWSADDPLALDQLATALLRRATVTGTDEDVSAALEEWQRLVARDQHRARWQLQFGRAAALAGDDESARMAWTAADALDPSDPSARNLLQALADHG